LEDSDNDNPVGLFGTVDVDLAGVAGATTSSLGLYPNDFACSASSLACFSISSKSISSASFLLILFAANLDDLGPLPFDDKIDFFAPVPLFLNLDDVVVVLGAAVVFFLIDKSSLEALGVPCFDESGDGVELIGLDQLEKKSSLELLFESETVNVSVGSSNVTISGCF
jgi:hypothetical protein